MKNTAYVLATITLAACSAIVEGWTFTKLWSWFIVTTFGLTALTIPAAIGFSLTVRFLTYKIQAAKNTWADWEALGNVAKMSIIMPLTVLSIGAIVKLWL